MTTRQILGAALIALPFVGLWLIAGRGGGVTWKELGVAVGTYLAVAAVLGLACLGVHLVTG